MTGDYLEPYLEPTLPADLTKADTSGTLDFSMPEAVRVLFGERERWTGATGDFMVVDAGVGRGAEPGARQSLAPAAVSGPLLPGPPAPRSVAVLSAPIVSIVMLGPALRRLRCAAGRSCRPAAAHLRLRPNCRCRPAARAVRWTAL